MRILKKYVHANKPGYVVLIPNDEEDLWHIYNLILKGDKVRTSTSRKISISSKSGHKNSYLKKLTMTLKIEKISYFTNQDRVALEIKGINTEEHEFISMGQYHTFQIYFDEKLTIMKENWEPFQLNILKNLSSVTHDTDIAAIVMDDSAVAHLCYVKPSITLVKQKIHKQIPKKKQGPESFQKEMTKFYQMCFEALNTVDFTKIKCCVIASPEGVRDEFLKYIKEKSQDEQLQKKYKQEKILEKILLVKCSNGYLDSLQEVLQDQSVQNKLQNTKALNQSKIMESFQKYIDENRAYYGMKSVKECISQQAIETLLLSDKLFRCKDFEKRKEINRLCSQVKQIGGETIVFSSMHPSGQRLNDLTGLACILRFPIDIEIENESDDDMLRSENFTNQQQENDNDEQEEEEEVKNQTQANKPSQNNNDNRPQNQVQDGDNDDDDQNVDQDQQDDEEYDYFDNYTGQNNENQDQQYQQQQQQQQQQKKK